MASYLNPQPFANLGSNPYKTSTYLDQTQGNAEERELLVQKAYTAKTNAQAAIKASEYELERQKELMKYQAELAGGGDSGGFFGRLANTAVGALASAGGAALFCERRLKQGIKQMDDRTAWQTIRDVPLYEFEYKHRPGVAAYGPMVDELRHIDGSLLQPMDAEAELLGIHDGKPIMGIRHDRRLAYESVALQQALRRIEALEAKIARMEETQIPPAEYSPEPRCWGGVETALTDLVVLGEK